ncbi:MAG: transposase [Muribaculaceae bacterium]
MDAAHFTLEAFLRHVWCRKPLSLRSGAGRNRFNVLGCIDPFTFDLIESHSMEYVDAGQVKDFLGKVRDASGDIPVSIVLDNARYQHCQAVKEEAARLNIKLIFMPPYSPNLNIIERLWKYTRRHVLAGK